MTEADTNRYNYDDARADICAILWLIGEVPLNDPLLFFRRLRSPVFYVREFPVLARECLVFEPFSCKGGN